MKIINNLELFDKAYKKQTNLNFCQSKDNVLNDNELPNYTEIKIRIGGVKLIQFTADFLQN